MWLFPTNEYPMSRIQDPTPYSHSSLDFRFWGRQHTARCSGLPLVGKGSPPGTTAASPQFTWATWGMKHSMEFGEQRSMNDKCGKGAIAYRKLKGKRSNWSNHREEANWTAVNTENRAWASESWPPNLTVHNSFTVAWNNWFRLWENWDLTKKISLGKCRKSSLFFMTMILKL